MKEAWQKAPLTSLIILIQVLVFILMTLAGGSTNSQVLVEFGARYTPLIKAGEWWRLITPGFVHIGLTHLVVNSVTLYFIGMYIENLFGHWRFLAIYLVSTLMGNLASAVFLPQSISAGASTGIFGLFGAFLMLGLAFWDEPAIHSLAHQFLILVLLNLGTDILVPGIDLAGHDEVMGMSVDAGFDTKLYVCNNIQLIREMADPIQFLHVVHNDPSDVVLKRHPDLFIRLVVAVEADLFHREADRKSGKHLAARNNVCAQSLFIGDPVHLLAAESLGCKADPAVSTVELLDRRAIGAHGSADLVLFHNVERRTVLFGENGRIDSAEDEMTCFIYGDVSFHFQIPFLFCLFM